MVVETAAVAPAPERSLSEQDQKTKRYDRQIRIWGKDGQERLETAKVCLLGAGPTGSEAMKNLVLGGVSDYTIVDGAKVEMRDLGNNFLVDTDSLGQSKAECCSRLLQEFNESVSGRFIAETPEHIIDNQPEFFKTFTLVLATQLGVPYQIKLDKICREFGVTLILGRSYGLFGSVRISAREPHVVVESKPENVLQDLRVNAPWDELEDYCSALDLASLDDMTYKHVPFVVILIKAAAIWRQKPGEGGRLPEDRPKQREFKAFLRDLQRSKDGFLDAGENFKEAVENAHYLWSPPELPSEVAQYFAHDKACAEVSGRSGRFWICLAALKAFVEAHPAQGLPLPGSIPDMTATTDLYLDLKRIYERKAEADVAQVAENVRKILARDKIDFSAAVGDDYLRLFCKNARNLKVLTYPPIEDEFGPLGSGVGSDRIGSSASSYLQSLLLSEDTAENAFVYALLVAVDRFFATHGHFPGKFQEGIEEDITRLKLIIAEVVETGNGLPISEEYTQEITRCGAGEVHTIAAVIGGIVSEEAIKIITKQFVPLKGTLIYNAIRSTTLVVNSSACCSRAARG